MTQIEQIKAEIERLKSQLVRGACAAGIAMETNCKEEAYNEVLAFIDSLPGESPSSTDMIAAWEKEELPMLREKDYQDAERMAYNAFLDGWARGIGKSKLRDRESWISEAKREKSFMEYLRGVFEANNGVENDPDLLVKLHAPTLLELAQKELPDSPDFDAEWERYSASRKDDMRTNAVTMNVKEVAKHFAEWGAEHLKSNH